ncbi:hypothetical protein T484DRAFT_1850483 [Baffinella frigidus]|nr:hypothetical protein T484DRAFT_1850483 [Cryptophyta sp. CCMP2293]
MAAVPQGNDASAKLHTLRARVSRLQGEVTAEERSAASVRARVLALEADGKAGGLQAKGKQTMLVQRDENGEKVAEEEEQDPHTENKLEEEEEEKDPHTESKLEEEEEEKDPHTESKLTVNGVAVESPAEALLYPKAKAFATWNPKNGLHKEETPDDYKKLNEKGPTEEGPRLRWCKWATQLVPCAPGHGGAWVEHHSNDRGILTKDETPKKAGKRSQSYLDDLFTYGQAGVFGARKHPRAPASRPPHTRAMLATAAPRAAATPSAPRAAALRPVAGQASAVATALVPSAAAAPAAAPQPAAAQASAVVRRSAGVKQPSAVARVTAAAPLSSAAGAKHSALLAAATQPAAAQASAVKQPSAVVSVAAAAPRHSAVGGAGAAVGSFEGIVGEAITTVAGLKLAPHAAQAEPITTVAGLKLARAAAQAEPITTVAGFKLARAAAQRRMNQLGGSPDVDGRDRLASHGLRNPSIVVSGFGSRVSGLGNPSIVDDFLSPEALKAAGLSTTHPKNDAPGAVFGIQDPAVFEEAMQPKAGKEYKGTYKDAAAVYGIQDPAVFDEAMKPKAGKEYVGDYKDAAAAMKPKAGKEYVGDYKDAAAVWGIQDPKVFDDAMQPKKGLEWNL